MLCSFPFKQPLSFQATLAAHRRVCITCSCPYHYQGGPCYCLCLPCLDLLQQMPAQSARLLSWQMGGLVGVVSLPSWCIRRAFQQGLIWHITSIAGSRACCPAVAMRSHAMWPPASPAMRCGNGCAAGLACLQGLPLCRSCVASACHFMQVGMQQFGCQVSFQEGVRNVSAGAVHSRKHGSRTHGTVQQKPAGHCFGVIAEVLG